MRYWTFAASAVVLTFASHIAAANGYTPPPTVMGLQPSDPQLHGGYPPSENFDQYPPKTKALLKLRAEGLRLRDADGGTLTDEHRAYLQKKLDAIQAEYPDDVQAGSQ
jgi:hypothetical protein